MAANICSPLLRISYFIWVSLKFLVVNVSLNFTKKLIFRDEPVNNRTKKVTISDVVKPYSKCVQGFNFSTYIILVAAFLFFLWRTIRVVYQIANYADIKKFYNTALKIEDVS